MLFGGFLLCYALHQWEWNSVWRSRPGVDVAILPLFWWLGNAYNFLFL